MAKLETIEEVKRVIRQFHPDPSFYETTYSDIPLEQYFSLQTTDANEADGAVSPQGRKPVLPEQELDRFIDDLLDSPELEITPPDMLVSLALQWEGEDLDQIKVMADALPTEVVRAKGFVEKNGSIHIFNYVMGTWTIEPADIPAGRIKHRNIIVFIGPPESMEQIAEAAKAGDWTSRGVFQPYLDA